MALLQAFGIDKTDEVEETAESNEAEESLYVECRGKRQLTAPGTCFKVKVDGRWLDYAPRANEVLKQAYTAGMKSVRFAVKGNMYKFNFVHMRQTQLMTMKVSEMRAPRNVVRPTVPALDSWDTIASPLDKGVPAMTAAIQNRNLYCIPVTDGNLGTTIDVPHPRKLGKQMRVTIPEDANVGQPLVIPVPRKVRRRDACAASGSVGAGAGALTAVFVSGEATAGGTAAAAGGGLLAAGGLSTIAPALAAGAAAAGAVALSAAAVHYATRNPVKAAAIGTLAVGGLAFADHVGDVGAEAALEDVIQTAGDVVDAARETGGELVDVYDYIRTEVGADGTDHYAGQATADVDDFVAADDILDADLDMLLLEADHWVGGELEGFAEEAVNCFGDVMADLS